VLRYLPTNLTAPEIAAELYVSLNTVKTHTRNLYAKLGTHRRAEAVARARSLGLLAPSALSAGLWHLSTLPELSAVGPVAFWSAGIRGRRAEPAGRSRAAPAHRRDRPAEVWDLRRVAWMQSAYRVNPVFAWLAVRTDYRRGR
jgi:hypothetical protein